MPPHCDTRDGPVVKAAEMALATGNVNHVLIWVPEEAEHEATAALRRAIQVRKGGAEAQRLADDWFFETVIRLHRAGEGAPYTGLKPAGLDEGPVVPRAEDAIETGDPQGAIGFILRVVEDDLQHRFRDVMAKKKYDVNDVEAGRAYTRSFINFVVYAHHLYEYVKGSGPHGRPEEGDTGKHGH